MLRGTRVEATSRRSRLRKLSPPPLPKTRSIVLALLMPPPDQAGRDNLTLCVVLWTAWCFESQDGTSPRGLAFLLRLDTCYEPASLFFFVFCEQPPTPGWTKKEKTEHSNIFFVKHIFGENCGETNHTVQYYYLFYLPKMCYRTCSSPTLIDILYR